MRKTISHGQLLTTPVTRSFITITGIFRMIMMTIVITIMRIIITEIIIIISRKYSECKMLPRLKLIHSSGNKFIYSLWLSHLQCRRPVKIL